jgi:hypothetical protein
MLTSRLDIFNRWRVEIRPQNEVTGEFSESRRTVQYMFNYFNVGTTGSPPSSLLIGAASLTFLLFE